MKLYTYFRAQEIAHNRLINLAYSDNHNEREWYKLLDQFQKQFQHIRDGLITRMERIELQLAQEKAKALELAEKKDYLD